MPSNSDYNSTIVFCLLEAAIKVKTKFGVSLSKLYYKVFFVFKIWLAGLVGSTVVSLFSGTEFILNLNYDEKHF